jgi:PAB1-binding protein PBP1
VNPSRLPNGSQAPKDTGAFPPLTQPNGSRPSDAERIIQALTGLIGTTVTVSTKTSQRYEGVVMSTVSEGDTTGVTLKDVKEISSPGAPLKDQMFIASTNIELWSSGPADARALNGDSFKTDTDISQKAGGRRERELTAWSLADSSSPPATVSFGALADDATFGPGAAGSNGTWDQFAANEKLFGVRTNFDEDVYTTRIDRNAADYKERERKAQQIANEIMGSSTSNPHIHEERIMDHADDSGVNEEEKYAGVIRSANAYVPPGARKAAGVAPPEDGNKTEIPKVSVNAPDGSAITPSKGSPAPTKPSADQCLHSETSSQPKSRGLPKRSRL